MRGSLGRIVGAFLAHGCVSHGAALAFYALFVLVPVPIFVASGAALFVGDELARAEVVEALKALTGDQIAITLGQVLEAARELPSWSGARLFGAVSLVFGATAFFVELQDTLHKIWETSTDRPRWRRIARSRLVSFVMVLASGTLLLVLTLVGALVRAYGEKLEDVLPFLSLASGATSLVVSFLVIASVFGLVFRFVPDAEVSWRSVWIGALATAFLFVGGNELIGLYLRTTRLASVYGAAGSLVLTLTWVYYSALAFLFGAELTRAVGERRLSV